MIKNRLRYWSCSKVADFIRGQKKPPYASLEGWEEWRKDCESKSPIRYWLAEKGLRKLQNIFYFPYDLFYTCKIYIRNRFIDKIHYLKTNLKPGSYYDLDTRILYGIFNELVDFVEVELAGKQGAVALIELDELDIENKKTYKFIKGRCKQAGIDYLNWASNLTYKTRRNREVPTNQATNARKILKLYNWWLDRPNRVDPFDIFDKNDKDYYKKVNEKEEDYYKEDNNMLIEVIKIREGLWS
jgi:hypothetical protein